MTNWFYSLLLNNEEASKFKHPKLSSHSCDWFLSWFYIMRIFPQNPQILNDPWRLVLFNTIKLKAVYSLVNAEKSKQEMEISSIKQRTAEKNSRDNKRLQLHLRFQGSNKSQKSQVWPATFASGHNRRGKKVRVADTRALRDFSPPQIHHHQTISNWLSTKFNWF